MKPIDYRNSTFADIRTRLAGDRLKVLDALREFGPCTTRELAADMDWDILNVRPRVTELLQLDLIEIVIPSLNRSTREGIYRALNDHEAEAHFQTRQNAQINPQLTLI